MLCDMKKKAKDGVRAKRSELLCLELEALLGADEDDYFILSVRAYPSKQD